MRGGLGTARNREREEVRASERHSEQSECHGGWATGTCNSRYGRKLGEYWGKKPRQHPFGIRGYYWRCFGQIKSIHWVIGLPNVDLGQFSVASHHFLAGKRAGHWESLCSDNLWDVGVSTEYFVSTYCSMIGAPLRWVDTCHRPFRWVPGHPFRWLIWVALLQQMVESWAVLPRLSRLTFICSRSLQICLNYWAKFARNATGRAHAKCGSQKIRYPFVNCGSLKKIFDRFLNFIFHLVEVVLVSGRSLHILYG